MELETRPTIFGLLAVVCLLYLKDGSFGLTEPVLFGLTYWITKWGKLNSLSFKEVISADRPVSRKSNEKILMQKLCKTLFQL